MPDAALAPLAAARPADWWRLALAGTAGSAVGGLVSYGVGRSLPVRPLLARLPLVRPAMVEAAAGWLAAEGARGLRHQSFSGVPFKVFALLAGARGLPLGPFLLWGLVARGSRFMAVCGVAALLGRRASRLLHRHPRALLAAWSVAFTVGLRRTVAAWDRRASRQATIHAARAA
jgi:membrane protein YqaA with SNARE-associated domain